jgi:drug/metabolite transporter (DMT)-like permease
MPADVAALVVLSALMHAGWNVLVKRSQDAQLDSVSFALTASGLAALILPFAPFPQTDCVPWMAASLLMHVGYFISLIEAYRHADLSVTYPLMRGLAPVLVTGLAFLAGDSVSYGQGMGIALVGIGIVLPAWIGLGRQPKSRMGMFFGILNAVIISLYTLLDGMGVRAAGTAIGYTLWMFFLNGWGILAYTIWQRGAYAVRTHLHAQWRISLLGASLSIGSYGIVLWAMSRAPIASVAALREVSVVFAAVMGAWWLHERMGLPRIIGACLVAGGVIMIKLFGSD